MEITGKVIKLGNFMEGQGANGPWRKQELIIQTDEQYPKTVCLQCWGDQAAEAQNLQPEQNVRIQFRLESREFNGKWYTDARAWRIENMQAQPAAAPQQQYQQPQQPMHQTPPIANTIPADDNTPTFDATDPNDDLPF